MDNKLSGKNVLLISPVFFNYYKEMIKALEKMGASVEWFDERPSNSNLVKAILRVNKNFINYKLDKYYKSIINKIHGKKYDYILIVKPEGIPNDIIRQLKDLNPQSRIVIYLWDSIANNKEAKEKIKLADKVFSFDPIDCKKYNMNFRPLFYIEKYNELTKTKNKPEYDLLFVGTVHSDRYKVLKNVEKQLYSHGYKVNYYMYVPSRILFLIRKFVLRNFSGSTMEEFKFKSLSQDQIVSMVEESKVVVDIQHPKQIGLTMRTIEMLGADKKIITTNNHVKEYDFYNEDNILVVDREMNNLDMEFFKKDYVPIDKTIKEKYSLEAWLLELLCQ